MVENSRMVIDNIQIFSTSEKKAKKVNFKDGINVITSNQINGNKVGKSLVLKSIYHTLGADSYFDSSFKKDTMIFVIQFFINYDKYTMLRSGKFFKLFNSKYDVLLQTDSATELAKTLYNIYSFYIYLPSRNEKKLTLAPPAYAYILNFIDQDKMNGSNFNSFERLGQFTNYKENLLYCHFGLFNQNYFNLTLKKEELTDRSKTQNQELELVSSLLEKIQQEMPKAVPESVESLRYELQRKEENYKEIYAQLKKAKDKLFKLRNNQTELNAYLKELSEQKNIENRELETAISDYTCPTCSQPVKDTLKIRINKNVNIEDLSQMSLEIQSMLVKNEKDISKFEVTYDKYLKELKEYKKILRGSRKNQEDIIQLQAYSDLKTKLEKEWSQGNLKVQSISEQIKSVDKQLKTFKKKKDQVNSSYFISMKKDKIDFELQEIPDESIGKITDKLQASGSNNPIVTILWYFNLLKLKNEYNPSVIKFPIVLDSPNHGELDDTKKDKLFEYLFSNISKDSQCIISTLGFEKNKYKDLDINIITFSNQAYSLFNEDDYRSNKPFLDKLVNK